MKLSSVKNVTVVLHINVSDRPNLEQATENDQFLLAPFDIRKAMRIQ